MIDTVGIFPNPTKESWGNVAKEIVEHLRAKDVRVAMDPSFLKKHPADGVKADCPLEEANVLISLGGDGTLLNLVGSMKNCDLPIIGVNLGGLGFLTEFTPETVLAALDRVLAGDYEVQERITLTGIVLRNDTIVSEHVALNDVVIGHRELARLLKITVLLDGAQITTYQADGLIVCTPTGSTAYSLSAGGPIVEPTLDAILITPICPHTITNKPIIVPSDRRVRVLLPDPGREAAMTIDGQVSVPIRRGDVIEVRQSETKVKLIKSPTTSFFGVLRNKLGWGGSKNFDNS
jgi:NAD+ kinase